METTEYQGKFIKVVKRNGWEFVDRNNVTGIVAIIPLTDDDNIVLVKQYREPLQKHVIEVPAGLAGDIDDKESRRTAAERELLEETGYFAHSLTELGTFCVSPGLCTEMLTYFIATDLEKKNKGGGDETEQIEILELPVRTAGMRLMAMTHSEDVIVDAKIFTSLFFAFPVFTERLHKKMMTK